MLTKGQWAFIVLEVLTFAWPFFIVFCFGRGIWQVSLMFTLFVALMVATIWQIRRNLPLAISGLIVGVLTFVVMIMLPGYISSRKTLKLNEIQRQERLQDPETRGSMTR